MPTGGDAPLSIDLPLAGLECAVHAGQARRALLGIDGVADVALNPLTALTTLHLGSDGARLREIKSALRRAGVGHGEAVHGACSAGADQWRAAEARRASVRVWWGLPLALLVWLPQVLRAVPGVLAPLEAMFGSAVAPQAVLFVQGVLAAVLLGLHARTLWQGLAGLLRGAPDGAALATLAGGGAWLWGALLLFVAEAEGGPAGDAGLFFATSAAVLWLHGVDGWLFARVRRALWARVSRLHALLPQTANVEGEGGLVELPPTELQPGDRVRVAAGRRFPADGEVVHGASRIDESLFGRQVVAVNRRAGQGVLAGTLNLSAPLTVRVRQAVGATQFQALLARLEAALVAQLPSAPRDEQVAAWGARLAAGLGALAVPAAWALGAAPSVALLRGLALVAVALPATLAWPAALAGALALLRAAAGGRLIAGGGAPARLAKVDLLVVPRSALMLHAEQASRGAGAAGTEAAGVPAEAMEALQALGGLGVEVLLRDDAPRSSGTRLMGIGSEAAEVGNLAAQQAQGRRVAALHLAQTGSGADRATVEAWVSCGAPDAVGVARAADAEALLLQGGLTRLPGLLRGARASQRLVLGLRVLGPAFGLAGMLLVALWPGSPQPVLAAVAATACVGLLLAVAVLVGRGPGD